MASHDVDKQHYRPSWVVDLILTTMFAFLVGFILICFYTTNRVDLYVFLGSCVLIYMAIKATDLFCIHIARDIISKKILANAPFNDPLSSNKTFAKFVGTMWQLVIHVSMTIWELYILYDETWLEKPWTVYSQPWAIDYEPKTSLRLIFLLQMAIWVCTCFSHRFNSEAHMHKDYIPMYVHHIVTIALVSIAYVTRHTRAGFVVLYIHDISDIGIDLLKICNYFRLEGRKGLFLVESAYAFAVGLWAYYRLYLFPTLILTGALRICYNSGWLAPDGTTTYPYYLGETYGYDSSIYYFSVVGVGIGTGLLCILLLLHAWWFMLLLRILKRLLSSENPHEIAAAEYEGSDHDEAIEHDTCNDQPVSAIRLGTSTTVSKVKSKKA